MRSQSGGLCGVAVLCVGSVCWAQETRFDLVGVGPMANSAHGGGVELIFSATDLPEGGLDELEGAPAFLCSRFTPELRAFVHDNAGDEDPGYLAITIRSGGMVGSYIRDYFVYDEGGCGPLM